MLMPDYKILMRPYSNDGCTVELLVKWLNEKSGCTEEVISLAIRNVFTEMASGKTFPTDKCDCGCEMTNCHSAMNHYTMRTAKELQAIANREYWQVLEKVDHERIIKHMEIENEKYIAEHMKPPGKISRFFRYIFDTSDNFPPPTN